MTEVLAEELKGRAVVALSGPSFALEVARRQRLRLSRPRSTLRRCGGTAEVRGKYLRLYGSDDVVGVEWAAR